MSSQELDIGTAKLIKEFADGESIYRYMYIGTLLDIPSLTEDSFMDALADNDYLLVDNSLYQLDYKCYFSGESVVSSKVYSDGSIDFSAFYPDGGTNINEMLTKHIRRLKDESI